MQDKQRQTKINKKGVGKMRKRMPIEVPNVYVTVDTEKLQGLLMVGRNTAIKIGTDAGAKIKVGRRVLWNVGKIQKYIDSMSK